MCIALFFICLLIISDINIVYSWSRKNESKNVNNINTERYVISVLFSENNMYSENTNIDKKINTEQTIKKDKINIYKTNLWRVKIPSIGVDAPISEGTDSEALRRTVGHFKETDKWNGNVALAAHNRGYRCNFFQEIKNLKNGDIITYACENRQRNYKVILNKIIKETDWTYVENTKDNRLTLITCEVNKREFRRCVQAIEI